MSFDYANAWQNFNPRSPCGERPRQVVGHVQRVDISTHAPRAGSDRLLHQPQGPRPYFNPRSPCGERRYSHRPWWPPSGFQPTLPVRGATCIRAIRCRVRPLFQPTLPVRGATAFHCGYSFHQVDFNPRSPCGERHGPVCPFPPPVHFNPRSPCGERPVGWRDVFRSRLFQPTLPVRGATSSRARHGQRGAISTHAPRAGSDAA